MTDIATGDINYYGKNINTYAAISVNETGKEGVFFGTPEPAPAIETALEDFEFVIFENNVFKDKKEINTANQDIPSIVNPTSDEEERPKKCIIKFSVANSIINDGTFGFDKLPSDYKNLLKSNEQNLLNDIENLENEYNPFSVEGEQYFPPWVSIRVGQTIVLNLDKNFTKKDEYQNVAFENHPDFTFRYMKRPLFSNRPNEVTDILEANEVHITCTANNENPDGVLIKVKADRIDAGAINVWYPTPKTIDLQWYFVEITGDEKDQDFLESKIDLEKLQDIFEKGLNPTLININITNDPANIIDISAENARLKREGILKSSTNHNYIESNLKQRFVDTVRSNHVAQNSIVTLYLVNRKCLVTGDLGEDGGQYKVVAGFSPTGTGVAYGILDGEGDLQHTAIMHEIMHGLGLRHTFSTLATHTFKNKKTKNYMDYSPSKKYTWKWQWTKLHTYPHLR